MHEQKFKHRIQNFSPFSIAGTIKCVCCIYLHRIGVGEAGVLVDGEGEAELVFARHCLPLLCNGGVVAADLSSCVIVAEQIHLNTFVIIIILIAKFYLQ